MKLSLKANHNRKKKHAEIEDFLHSCDTVKIATELPVWHNKKTIESSITGHIDIVQLRGGKVFLLDSNKPMACEEVERVLASSSVRGKLCFPRRRRLRL